MAGFQKEGSLIQAAHSTPRGVNFRQPEFGHESSSVQQAIELSTATSRSLIKIDSCVPSTGSESISAYDWRRWAEIFRDSTTSMSAVDKLGLFRRCAGEKLRDLFEMLPGAADVGKCVGQNTIDEIFDIIDSYFSSEAQMCAAQLEFEGTVQGAEESNVSFLERVSKKAKSCGFSISESDKKVMDVIALNAREEEVRKEAMHIDRNSKRYTFLEFKGYILNMEKFRVLRSSKGSSVQQSEVNAVSSEGIRSEYTPSGANRFAHQRMNQPSTSRQLGSRQGKCDRCGSSHHESVCYARDMKCHGCGLVGHLRRVCKANLRPGMVKRKGGETGYNQFNKKPKMEQSHKEANMIKVRDDEESGDDKRE